MYCPVVPGFIRGIDEALKGNTAPLEERISVAKEHTYEIRTNKMLQLVEALPYQSKP